MKKYFDHSDVNIDTDNSLFSGIAYPPNFLDYDLNFKEYEIPPENEFRPDKIADELWGSGDLDWVLSDINGFTNGISEYTAGTTIHYLEENILIALGII